MMRENVLFDPYLNLIFVRNEIGGFKDEDDPEYFQNPNIRRSEPLR